MSEPELEKLANDYLDVKGQIDALEDVASAIKEEIEARVQALVDVQKSKAVEVLKKRWEFDRSAVTWVEASKRESLDRTLLVQNGVTAEQLTKSTVSKPVKAYAKVEGVK